MKSKKSLLAAVLALLSLVVSPAGPARAQELDLRRDVPAPTVRGCSTVTAVPHDGTAQDEREAARLVASAREAALLGDAAAARDLLQRAARTDTSAANIAFLFGRTLEELGVVEDAVREYCRYLRLAPDAPDTAEVRQRIARTAALVSPGIPDSAIDRFRAALAFVDAGRLDEAEAGFSDAIAAAPSWPTPYYNRALLRVRRNRRFEARADLERYLALEPQAGDATRVRTWISQLDAPIRIYSPGSAFFLGLIPGAGHFYTGRPLAGTALLAVAGGAAAIGVLYQRTQVECLTVPQNNVCPPDQVRDEYTERPWLLPAMGVAAAATLFGAIDAARGARSRNARAALDAAARIGAAVHVGRGRVDIALLRLRY
ncbi:MAG TPA: hypothetical protein VFZ24_01505 [Longimicrobiales bacterium]